VYLIDGDRITETNCVRQPFSRSEIGLYKAVVLINRLNLFWRLDWQAVPHFVRCGQDVPDSDFLISCVDTRGTRGDRARGGPQIPALSLLARHGQSCRSWAVRARPAFAEGSKGSVETIALRA
jgi:hypothetical protein